MPRQVWLTNRNSIWKGGEAGHRTPVGSREKGETLGAPDGALHCMGKSWVVSFILGPNEVRESREGGSLRATHSMALNLS